MTLRILAEADVPIAKLKTDPDNLNRHDERDIEHKMESLKAFGQPERLVARKSDGVVFAGNGRLEALQRLASKSARVQWVEGTDDECRAYGAASNRAGRLSRFDDQAVADFLEGLAKTQPELVAAAGWTGEELAGLIEAQGHEFPEYDESMPATEAEDAGKTRCPSCGFAFKPGEKGLSAEGREHREAKKAAKGKAKK